MHSLFGTNLYGHAYDTIGNRKFDTFNGTSRSYATNCLNQYTAVNRTIEQSNNPAYDADGNLIQDDRFNYTYDAENRLVSIASLVITNGAVRVLNAYDHKHRCILKRAGRFDEGERHVLISSRNSYKETFT